MHTFYNDQQATDLLEKAKGVRDYLFDFGPKTMSELSEELCISMQTISRFLRVGKENGLIEPVAHVHGRGHSAPVYYVAGMERDWRGRFCTCSPKEKYYRREVIPKPKRSMTFDPNFLPWLLGGE